MKKASLPANPWLSLPKREPFALPEDISYLDVYSKAGNPSLTAYHLNLLPLPFQGRIDAPVVLLSLNPGYAESDETQQTTSCFVETNLRNYRHDSTLPYPLFFLDPAIEGGATKGGQRWWHRRLKPLREKYDDKLLARTILSVQYFPYRSSTYKPTKRRLDSQEYSFSLVRQAVERGALIIALRSERLWKEAVKELEGYVHFHALSSPRYPVLSEKQLKSEGYQKLIAELEKAR